MLAVAFIAILVIGIASLCAGVALVGLDWQKRTATPTALIAVQVAQEDEAPAGTELDQHPPRPDEPAPAHASASATALFGSWRATAISVAAGLACALLVAWVGIPVWMALLVGTAAALSAQSPFEQIEKNLSKRRTREESDAAINDDLRRLREGGSPVEAFAIAPKARSGDLDLLAAGVSLRDEALGGTSAIYSTVAEMIARRRALKSIATKVQSKLFVSTLVALAIAIVVFVGVSFATPNFLTPLFVDPLGRLAFVTGLAGFSVALVAVLSTVLKEIEL